LDFGCREGRYTVPAAGAVGPNGFVYAVDKDAESLRNLRRKIRELAIGNVRVSRAAGSGRLTVPRSIADVVLLYDVLHGGYFPDARQRVELVQHIYTATRPGGMLSCYPTHVKQYGLTFRQLHEEVGSAGFRLEGEARRTLVHSDRVVRGWVFKYRKPRRGKRG
jgi:tRNA A58 N-methylase Trm61